MSHISSSVMLKNLQSQKAEAHAELKSLEGEKKQVDEKVSKLRGRLKSIDRQIKELTTSAATPVVSEHALLRYFERVLGYDLEEIKKQILAEKTVEQIRLVRSGTFPGNHNGSNFRLRVKDSVVITVLGKDER